MTFICTVKCDGCGMTAPAELDGTFTVSAPDGWLEHGATQTHACSDACCFGAWPDFIPRSEADAQ